MIGGPAEVLCSRMRINGYTDALRTSGLTVDPELIRHGDFEVSSGHREALALLSLPVRPTAIFAGSDLRALGVYQAPVAEWVGPTLTTVHQPLRKMAELAARLVLDLARGVTPAALRMDLAVEMRTRQSTAPPATLLT